MHAAGTATLEALRAFPDQLEAHFALIHYLCSHHQQHLAGLQWLLGKARSAHK